MEWLYSLLGFVLGTVAGYYAEKVLSALDSLVSRFLQRSRHRRFERAWEEYKSLSADLEVIQAGWKSGRFVPAEVVLTLGADFELPQEVMVRIRDSHKAEWEQAGLTDNFQIGLVKIDPHRMNDEVG